MTVSETAAQVRLIHGDALAVLRDLPSESFDAVVTDPPYGMGFQSAWTAPSARKAKIEGDARPFIWFLHDAYRVTKDGGAIVCFTDWKNEQTWRIAIETAGFVVRSQCVCGTA